MFKILIGISIATSFGFIALSYGDFKIEIEVLMYERLIPIPNKVIYLPLHGITKALVMGMG